MKFCGNLKSPIIEPESEKKGGRERGGKREIGGKRQREKAEGYEETRDWKKEVKKQSKERER